jgi:dTDP-4-dehydrorhamnose reductase
VSRPLQPDKAVELWAGIECTVNRVGDAYHDQLRATGHHDRDGDLDLAAWLGVAAIRYPVLWERTAPQGLALADWRWADRRLARLKALGIRPVVGLVHHGSGPRDTSLLDPEFPDKLAVYARAVAERFPWVSEWTPINEPLTTARFSALYGHWYPHARSRSDFYVALANQCLATARAMQEIRRVIPGARLVQTEDLGRTYATAACAVQADYEQRRRLLGFDLLCGQVTAVHPLWNDLRGVRAVAEALDTLAAAPCPPDVIGINYYLTSDRFLDDALAGYPPSSHGGNGHQAYADVEAVRVAGRGITGHAALLSEIWTEYGLPVALTEVHLGCTREEQLRWFAEAWAAAGEARRAGADVRAVTPWALFGCFGWDQLARGPAGTYEPGVFDVRAPRPRTTAIARAVEALAHGRPFEHPALDGVGWWRRSTRVLYPAPVGRADVAPPGQPILVMGARGTLGAAVVRAAKARGLAVHPMTRADVDIADPGAVAAHLANVAPWAVINAAGYVSVDAAEGDPARCWRENVTGAVSIARLCRDAGIPFVTFSSDLVFDGKTGEPYVETAKPSPLNVYGTTKAAAEAMVLACAPPALVIRTAAFFGPWDTSNFVTAALATIGAGRTFAAAADLFVSPTYVPDLASATLDLLVDEACGIWHLCNEGVVSWAELARRAATAVGLDPGLVQEQSWRDLGFVAPRPAFSALATRRGRLMSSLDVALSRYAAARGSNPEMAQRPTA